MHLLINGAEEEIFHVKAGGASAFYRAQKDVIYITGCHADVKEGTEIKLTVYDGGYSELY